MYILKKLNQEKKVMTAQQAADLEEKGWEIIQQVEAKLEVNIDGIAEKISEKIGKTLKSQIEEMTESPDPESALEEVAPAQPKGEKESETETESEQEKKTSTKSRKKE